MRLSYFIPLFDILVPLSFAWATAIFSMEWIVQSYKYVQNPFFGLFIFLNTCLNTRIRNLSTKRGWNVALQWLNTCTLSWEIKYYSIITLNTTHFQSIQTKERKETIIIRTKFESWRHDSLSLYLSGKSINLLKSTLKFIQISWLWKIS